MASILVVEKDRSVRDYVKLHLESVNHSVSLASNHADGLEIVQTWSPALVFADLDIAKTRGYDFLEAIRSNPASAPTPVILLSEDVDPSVLEESTRRGAKDCLFKPINRQELLDAASGQLDKGD